MNIKIGNLALDIPVNSPEVVLIEGFTVDEGTVTKFGRIEVLQPGVRGWLQRLKREVKWPVEEARRQARKLAKKAL